jgi:hypothetical protein
MNGIYLELVGCGQCICTKMIRKQKFDFGTVFNRAMLWWLSSIELLLLSLYLKYRLVDDEYVNCVWWLMMIDYN